MARLPRLTVPGLPHHLIQRGNNQQSIFLDDQDYAAMHALLALQAREAQVAVHAYVLLDSELQLLATPASAEALSRFMQAVGRRYVRQFNQRHGRSGTLWEGRYRCAVLQAETWLMPCMSRFDLLPVQAGRADSPAAWVWSSHRHYAGAQADQLVSPHSLYWSLGDTPFAREQAYARQVEAGLTAAQQAALVDAALHGWALGDGTFLANLQKQTERRITRGKPGRPRKGATAIQSVPNK
jgi:putative transposase